MSTHQRPTCGECRFFDPQPHNGRGRCFGNPPVLVQSQTHINAYEFTSMRPSVNDQDTGCQLWQSSAARSTDRLKADIISGPD